MTIILSALTGAISAILGGLVVEYVRPHMARWRKKKMIREMLNDEFLTNLGELEAALRVSVTQRRGRIRGNPIRCWFWMKFAIG